MEPSKKTPSQETLGSICLAIALQFVFLEFIKAHRAADWVGNDLAAWLGALVTLTVYLVVLAGVATVLRIALRRAFTGRASTNALAVYGAALLLWTLLSVHRENAPTADDLLVLLLLSVSTVIIAIAARQSAAALARVITILCGAAIVGALGATLAAHAYMLDPSRPDKVVYYAAAFWTVPAIVACAVTLRRRSATIIATVASLTIIIGTVANYESVTAFGDNIAAARGPNLVLIVIDTLRPDVLQAYGGDLVTPAFSKLAEQGALFERAYAMAPWTVPSMTGMFSSRHPPGLAPEGPIAVWREELWRYRVDSETPTLAERLSREGYETVALLGNPLLCCVWGIQRGFEQASFSHPITIEPKPFFSLVPFFHDTLHRFFPDLPTERFNPTTRILGRRAVHWLRQRGDAPFFMWVHFIDPHAPYDPPKRFRTREGPWPFFWPYPTRLLPDSAPTLGNGLDLNQDEKAYVRSLYNGEVQHVDEGINAILAALSHMGLDDNTYVCITSDHGEELWDHGGWSHGHTLYEEQLRVPLMIRGPGIEPQVIEGPVSLIDLTPTLAELMGIEGDEAWKGDSLARALKSTGGDLPNAPIFAHATNASAQPEQLQTVIVGDDKLIRGALSGTRWLYNLEDDPSETNNLVQSESDLVNELEILLEGWLETFEMRFYPGEGDIDSNQQRRTDQALRALGYLE